MDRSECLVPLADQVIRQWSKRNGITVNKAKSGILVPTARKRQRMISAECGYTLVNSLNYLGVTLDD